MPRRLALFALLTLAACNRYEPAQKMVADLDVREAPGIVGQGRQPAAATPAIAYSYGFTYRLPTDTIARVQSAHVALCDKLGPARCRVESSITTAGEDGYVANSLSLLVDARVARAFGRKLDAAAASEGGEATRHEISAEDLSKAMIDTGARIRAKQALADRLLVLLQTKSGGVADLVAAERAYADVQEELDAARTQMAEMQGRVAQSKITVTYESREASGHGFARPLRDAANEAGQTLGSSIGALLTFVIAALPWLLLLAALLWLKRRLGWRVRWPWRRRAREQT